MAGRVTVSGGAGRDFVSIAAPPAGARISGVEANELDIDLVEAMLEFLADSGLADSVMDLIPAAQPLQLSPLQTMLMSLNFWMRNPSSSPLQLAR